MASRMIASAKSWLCHPGVDRQAAILPWGDGDGPKLSPVEAQALILGHVRDAWDHAHPDAPLAEQEVLVTVPASFDEAARELTLAGGGERRLPPVVLLEEPQAAFYAWIDRRSGAAQLARRRARAGVRRRRRHHRLHADRRRRGDGFTRTAVGDHLLLGGDNLDLTLAKLVEQRAGRAQRQEARRAAVARPGPRLPAREGDAARRRTPPDAPRRSSCRPRREADRRHAARRDHARRARQRAVRRLLPASSRATRRSRAAAAACRSSACPTQPTRR